MSKYSHNFTLQIILLSTFVCCKDGVLLSSLEIPTLCLLSLTLASFLFLFPSFSVLLPLSLFFSPHVYPLKSHIPTLFSPSLCLWDGKSYALLFIIVQRLVRYITSDVCYMFFNKFSFSYEPSLNFEDNFFLTFASPFDLLPSSL